MENNILHMITKIKPIPGPVTEASHLYADLGLDSLSFIALLLEIEEAYLITFNVLEIENCLQVRQLIDMVRSKVEAGAAI